MAASGFPPMMFGAGGPMLKRFDQSTASSRKGSQAPTPPKSVVGIGNKVAKPDYSEAKIVLAMVGLPARGKSYLSNKLMRYLKWLEYNVKVFNVGQLRRSRARQRALQSGVREDHTASYFSHNNPDATRSRDQLAEDSLEMLIQWLRDGGNVGIHDATNSTRARRAKIEARVAKEKGIVVIFLESVCNDPAVIAANVALKVSSGDPDYNEFSREAAERDFLRRIREYESVYETITEPHLSYLRLTNVGSEVTLSRINGYLQSRIAFYLMNLHLKPRSIYLSRHGESQFNVEGKIGGDSLLSPRGMLYMKTLPALITDNIGDAPLTVWTSTLQRTIQTASELPYPKLTWKSLDELDAGVCDGMTYEEIEEAYPEDFANRDDDKFNYRYRGGESYRDVVIRLEPVIMELERQENILIVGHQAILRCLYAYFLDLPQADLPYIKIPLHTVIKLTPKAYGCDEERYTLPIGAVDTHRPKPKTAHQPNMSVANTGREYYGEHT
jgi:6-phosphofructo-2-kinase/fructose-2,6-biphosphatase 2